MEQGVDHVRSHPVERVVRMNVLVSGPGNSLPECVMAEVEADLVQSLLGISIPGQVLVVGEERLEPRDIPGDEEATTAQDEPGSVGEAELSVGSYVDADDDLGARAHAGELCDADPVPSRSNAELTPTGAIDLEVEPLVQRLDE